MTALARFVVASAFAASPVLCAVGESNAPDERPREPGPERTHTCLAELTRLGIPHVVAPSTRGVETPVEITGDLGGLALEPRGKRSALMDCTLALALWEAREHFASIGVDRLEFSAAYDYRTRRRSSELSAHARGLAIDVHVLRGPRVEYVIDRDFEAGVGAWRSFASPGDEARVNACIGAPRTARGEALRRLVCELKAHTKLCVIVTPDDDADHRDHLHLEASC